MSPLSQSFHRRKGQNGRRQPYHHCSTYSKVSGRSLMLSSKEEHYYHDYSSRRGVDNQLNNNNNNNNGLERRSFLLGGAAVVSAAALVGSSPKEANAIPLPFGKRTDLVLLDTKQNATADSIRKPFASEYNSAEQCLLRLLPVNNVIFRALESDIESVTVVRYADEKGGVSDQLWTEVTQNMNNTIKYFDGQRSRNLQPVFNPDDSTELEIAKAVRGEDLAESLRNELVDMLDAAQKQNILLLEAAQRRALMALANLGELLVTTFPYNVPNEGKFSTLPRLLGRATVTFVIQRKNTDKTKNIGKTTTTEHNVTIIADGYAAPITAGNFVDLCQRQFYTGLPVKTMRKRLGIAPTLTGEDNIVKYDIENAIENVVGDQGFLADTFAKLNKNKAAVVDDDKITTTANTNNNNNNTIQTLMPIMGSYEEGFYDPLTAKPRRIPLEIVRFDKLTGTAKLSYAGKKSDLMMPSKGSNTITKDDTTEKNQGGDFQQQQQQLAYGKDVTSNPLLKPVLNFNIPGLVALNHPDKNLNGGSSEFFSLTKKDMTKDKTRLLTGQYAPFGYIVEGADIMETLKPTDVISATYVSEWGLLNLVKIRGTSFADVMNFDSIDEDE